MEWSSWFRLSSSKKPNNPNTQSAKLDNKQLPVVRGKEEEEEEEELLGVTDQLIQHVKSFTLDTFINFTLEEEEEEGSRGGSFSEETGRGNDKRSSANVRKDLSDWQQRHALLVLSKVKDLSTLRFKLCPRHLKERQFWRIYFSLVKSYTSEYELQAVRLEKLKRMALDNEETSDNANEVEMAETTQMTNFPSPTP